MLIWDMARVLFGSKWPAFWLTMCLARSSMALEPRLIEAALARLSEKLSPADHRTIVKAARTPTRSGGRIAGASTLDTKRFTNIGSSPPSA